MATIATRNGHDRDHSRLEQHMDREHSQKNLNHTGRGVVYHKPIEALMSSRCRAPDFVIQFTQSHAPSPPERS